MNLADLLANLPAEQQPTYDLVEQQLAPHGTEVLARTLVGEAEGEGAPGQLAVAHVVRNRARTKQKPVEAIIKAPKQFSAWNEGSPRRPVMEGLNVEEERYQAALEHARKVLGGQSKDPTGGATFFKRKDMPAPWEKDMEKTVEVGQHEFFKQPRKKVQ